MRKTILSSMVLIALDAPATFSLAEDSGADAAEMARKLQDPLATIKDRKSPEMGLRADGAADWTIKFGVNWLLP